MREANNLDHPVRAKAIDDDVPGTANALVLGNRTAPNAEWVNPDARFCRHLLGAWAIGKGSQGGENGPHQQVVAFCRVDAEASCTIEQNTVDVGFRTCKEPIAQCPMASPASLARRRAMATSWSASLSSGVATIV